MFKLKRFIKQLLKLISKILILDLIVVGIIFLITRNMDVKFRTVLEFAGIILLSIGVMSFLGGRTITTDWSYNVGKSILGSLKMGRDEVDHIFSAYSFVFTTGIAGIIILLLTLFM